MNEEFVSIAIPTLIAWVFVNFVWAWILTAVNASEVPKNPAGIDPDWKQLERRPPIEGEELVTPVRPQTPVA
jgi:hypothetical protein